MKHVVLFSGGVASYVAAKRVIEKFGKEDVILLFTDTKTEDEDLYRFLDDTSKFLGIEITKLVDGRTIWEVFKDHNFLSNSRVDHCSQELKRYMSRRWIKANCKPDDSVIYIGFTWEEIHRLNKARRHWKPYQVEAPLTEYPYLTKKQTFEICEQDGIKIPRLYDLGLPHNNCGGGCVKAGIGHFAKLLDVFPERFAEWERNEQEIRDYLGKDVAILVRKNLDGVKEPYPLSRLRKNRQALKKSELCDIGGCGCFDGDNDLFSKIFEDLL